jgi:hypothetical protein
VTELPGDEDHIKSLCDQEGGEGVSAVMEDRLTGPVAVEYAGGLCGRGRLTVGQLCERVSVSGGADRPSPPAADIHLTDGKGSNDQVWS